MHGIIIRKTRVKENDLVINWLTQDDLMIAAYAGHIHHSQAYPNGLELMTVYEIELGSRPHAMASLKSAYHVEQFDNLIEDVAANACACAALEAVSDICPENSIVIDLFQTMLQVFAVMHTAPEYAPLVLAWFEVFVIHQMGSLPNLEMCAQCAGPLVQSAWYREEMGFFCKRCVPDLQNVPPFLLEALRRLKNQSLRQTLQNAVARNRPDQMIHVVAPVIRFLAATIAETAQSKKLHAHRYMADVVLGMPNLLDSSP